MHVWNYPEYKQDPEHSRHISILAKGGISFLGDFWDVFGEDLGKIWGTSSIYRFSEWR